MKTDPKAKLTATVANFDQSLRRLAAASATTSEAMQAFTKVGVTLRVVTSLPPAESNSPALGA